MKKFDNLGARYRVSFLAIQRINPLSYIFTSGIWQHTNQKLIQVCINIESYEIYRGSYMSAHVLLNLLNELGKSDKMRGLPSI